MISCLAFPGLPPRLAAVPLTYVMPAWWPWAVVLFAGVAAVAGWRFIRRPHPQLSRRLRGGLLSLRVFAALFLLLLLLDWRGQTRRSDSEKPLLRVLIDRSASMAVKDGRNGVSRFEEARDRLASAVRPAWNDPARVETAYAGESLSPEGAAGTSPDAPRSALGKALRETLEQSDQQVLGGVILFSDGAASDPDELRAAGRLYRTARVPVYPWMVGTTRQPADLRIVSASLRQPSPTQTGVHLAATLESPGYAGTDTTLSVKLDGQVLHQQAIRLNGARQTFSTDFVSPYLGCHFYDLELTPMDGETRLDNNHLRAACDLCRDNIRVLYMEGSAPKELSYLKDGLEEDPGMSVTCLHFEGDQGSEELAARAAAVRGRDKRIFYDGQGREIPSVCHPTRGYPITMRDLLQYDVVIDSDIIKEAFSPEQLANTVAFVEQYGGGFVMVGGLTSFGAGFYETTVIDKLMPIEIANRSDPLSGGFGAKVTETGWSHPIMQVGASPAETRAAWENLFPGFNGINYALRSKPGAYVLARTNRPGSKLNDLVLFAVQNVGRGRTMAFMSDTTEIWGTEFESSWGDGTVPNKYYRKFWNNSIRWLAADRIAQKGAQAVIETPDTPPLPGDRVPLRVASLSSGELAELAVSVRESDQTSHAVPLQWDGEHQRWEGSFVPKAPGDVFIEATYKNPEGATAAARSGIEVRSTSDETIAVAAQPALMEELARNTGGMVLNDENFSTALAQLAARTIPVTRERSVPAWDRWWVLVPLLLVIAAEWLLRRKLEPLTS